MITVNLQAYDAVLFDLDGVLTDTAKVHAACWKQLFDAFLRHRGDDRGLSYQPFDAMADYRLYVDGKPRYDGVRDFLASRGVRLAEGSVGDGPGDETVCGLGNQKNRFVQEMITTEGVEAFDGAVTLVRSLLDQGVKTAVVSSSKNCRAFLRAAGLEALFEVRVDGEVAAREGLRGKPAPDTFLEAARRLKVKPGRAVVVEDAIAGVRAGRAGGFGLVLGVARKGDAAALEANGADAVVSDLGELIR